MISLSDRMKPYEETSGMLERRASTNICFECYADEGYFIENREDIPEELKNDLEVNGRLPCELTGVPRIWCLGCRFRKIRILGTYGPNSIMGGITNDRDE